VVFRTYHTEEQFGAVFIPLQHTSIPDTQTFGFPLLPADNTDLLTWRNSLLKIKTVGLTEPSRIDHKFIILQYIP